MRPAHDPLLEGDRGPYPVADPDQHRTYPCDPPHDTPAPGARIDMGSELHCYTLETLDELVDTLATIARKGQQL